MSALTLDGTVAIITGASRGIGRAIAGAMHDAGARVVVTARTQEAADSAASEIGDRALGIGAHVADREAAAACVAATIERFGKVDILVNNVGTNPAYGPLIRQDAGQLAKLFEVNVFAPVLWSRLVCDAWMIEHGGSILNVASIGGLVVERDLGAYNASKAALIHMTKQLAVELAPTVRVNALAPGIVRTKLAEALWRDHEDGLNTSIPLGRIGEPHDVAGAAVFLSSGAASWITGEILVLDGGQRLSNQSSPAERFGA